MYKYAFLFGNHPTLSLAELISFLDNHGIVYGKYELLNDIFFVEIKRTPKLVAQLQDELGGIIKIFEIKEEFKGKIYNLEQVLTPEKLIKEWFAQKKTKINFGISVYSDPDPTFAEFNWLNSFAYGIKRKLKDDYSIRYVEDKSLQLSSVQVERNRLLDTGAEIVLISDKEKHYIGKTLSVQDYQSYSERDFDKPAPDAKSGMLPPKLAQILINLTHTKKTINIYDPFCGSGIVAQEALLMGFDTYGSDISDEAIKNTRKNIDWLIKLKKLEKLNVDTHFKEADATKIKWLKLNAADTVIVTEPYLGPPLKSILFARDTGPIISELTELYIGFFQNLKKNFPNIKQIGMVFPIFKTRDGLRYVEAIEEIQKLGYKVKKTLPPEIAGKDPGVSSRGGLIYSRPDQKVLRELFVFQR